MVDAPLNEKCLLDATLKDIRLVLQAYPMSAMLKQLMFWHTGSPLSLAAAHAAASERSDQAEQEAERNAILQRGVPTCSLRVKTRRAAICLSYPDPTRLGGNRSVLVSALNVRRQSLHLPTGDGDLAYFVLAAADRSGGLL